MIEYNEMLQSAYKMLKEYNRTDTVYTHSEIEEIAESICSMPKFKQYTALIRNQIVDLYEENIHTKAYEPDILSLNNDDTQWFFDKKDKIATPYFDRYAQYLSDQDFAEDTIKKIKESTEKILLKCANPNNETSTNKKKKGLVVGDVQSGKTSNYLALINMACDYGYKLIVLLAGMTETLRKQTQKRIDTGFIGAISESIGDSDIQFVGVGEEESKYYSVPFTNGKYDFNKIVKENQNSNVSDYNKPVVLVVKKNASVLNHVMSAINAKEEKLDRENILIIDDEADNASINTNNPDKNPTTINKCIRKIFNNYDIATYVGFTATPFANIFINPEEYDSFKDLFPSDFIVQLNSPDNYFGSEKVFKKDGVIRLIYDYEDNFLPTKHKKDYVYTGLSDSLIEAINCFIINNVLRTLDGAGKKHRSMLINISVFNDLQYNICYKVEEYLKNVINVFEQEGHLETERLIKNIYAKRIYDLYSSNFYNNEKIRDCYDWTIIQRNILGELKQFVVKVFNKTTSRDFNYDKDYPTGARLIVVGGYVLSRGLTLEGLMVSYYNRSSTMYDSMLQMCRWFGYRSKYEHLCRVYMTESNKENFLAVLEAVDDLKEQFQRMSMRGAKPSEFGLMVKESPDTLETHLMISASNKLKNSKEIVRTLNYSGIPVDTSKLFVDKQKNDDNRQQVFAFILELENKGKVVETKEERYIIADVNHKDIAKFLKSLKVSYLNTKFDTESLTAYILQSDMKLWDIAFATGDKSSKKYKFGGYELIAPQRRFLYEKDDSVIRIGGSNNRLVEPGIFNAGLTPEQKDLAKQNAEELFKKCIRKNKNVTARDYLDIPGRKPVLAIYPIEVIAKDEKNEYAVKIEENYKHELIYGFALGFPGKNSKVEVKYRMNKIKLQERINANEETEEDDEYED
ncbi:MAG TPA: Z1 domain-containing protein [Candidatus Pelethenecus sp.]|nr:Z1 domain-containing protein [Candidatus Pelethenecus sp.]